MSNLLTPGSNGPLTGHGPYTVIVTHKEGPDVDLTGFLLNASARVRSDADMIFFNQPQGPGAQYQPSEVALGYVTHRLIINPANWPNDVERVRIGLTVNGTTFGFVEELQATVTDASGTTVAAFDLSRRDAENAFIVGDVYRRPNGDLKVRCEGAGFTNGLAGLATDVGVSVDDDGSGSQTATEAPAEVKQAAVNFVKKLAENPPGPNASALDLRKHKLAVVLVKNKLDGKTFRVVLLIDASGSMAALYQDRFFSSGGGGGLFGRRRGDTSQAGKPSVVQCSLERMVPIADLFDDNHEMEVWYFGTRPSKSDSVTIDTMEGYVNRTQKQKAKAGYSNDEVAAMRDVIQWVENNPSPYPTLVLAWSDGGVGGASAILNLLRDASSLPIFWMWLGLGSPYPGAYGALEEFDKITGGKVDNCGFVEITDIEQMSDENLYEVIMKEVGKWFREASALGIIKQPAA